MQAGPSFPYLYGELTQAPGLRRCRFPLGAH
jgi:hypothetical protein